MKVVVAFSGGKDSLASLLWSINEFGLKNVEAVFCDTKWEHEMTYKHIEEVIAKSGVKLSIVSSKKYAGFVDLAKQKGRFPSAKARFCTEELKTKPMIDFILSQTENLLIVQGIRADESFSRSKMLEMCRFFKYYFEPYGRDKKGKLKFFTYRKKEVLKWVSSYTDDILRPIFHWSGQETIDYILKQDYLPNPLYFKGFSRVGCFPCIMCRQGEIKQMAKVATPYIDRMTDAENQVGRTFFSPDYIPKRFMSKIDGTTGKLIPTISDVIKYVSDDKDQTSLIEPDNQRCMSFYALCE